VSHERGPEDYPEDGAGIWRKRSPVGANRINVAMAVGTLLIQACGLAWYGGRLEQRVANHQSLIDKQDQELKELRRDIGTQGNSIAATNVAYADILRRLDSIDRKLDRR
jgi:hypothetical protein